MKTTIKLMDEKTHEENERLADEISEYFLDDEIGRSVNVRIKSIEMNNSMEREFGICLSFSVLAVISILNSWLLFYNKCSLLISLIFWSAVVITSLIGYGKAIVQDTKFIRLRKYSSNDLLLYELYNIRQDEFEVVGAYVKGHKISLIKAGSPSKYRRFRPLDRDYCILDENYKKRYRGYVDSIDMDTHTIFLK